MSDMKKNNRKYSDKKNKSRNNRPRNSYGNKGDKRNQDEGCDRMSYEKHSTTNDLSWYMANPQLVNDAARIPFGNQLGRPLDGIEDNTYATVPGVCALYAVPGPGIADSVTDAVNISATNIFQFIRKNLSTYASYAAADVMMYIMAVDELYSWYNYIARLFGIANNFSAYNLYYPKALLNANGLWDTGIESLRNHMNDYRAQFNSLIYKAASIYMPVDISIVKRHMWMFGNYFMDADSSKAQTYIYIPAGYHILDETSSDNGTMLKFMPIDHANYSMDDALDVFNQMIESIRNSDSMLKIAADMRRAYENSQSWTLSYIPENFTVLPIVDHQVLSQIMNSVIHPYAWANSINFDITQSVEHNKILYKPQGPQETDATSNTHIRRRHFSTWSEDGGIVLNFFKPDVTTEDIVEATRNISLFKVSEDGENTITFVTSGADIICGMRIFYKSVGGTGDYEFLYKEIHSYEAPFADNLRWLHAFNWAPNMYFINVESGIATISVFVAFDNYAQIKLDDAKRLNEGVLTSMWHVPDFRQPTAK